MRSSLFSERSATPYPKRRAVPPHLPVRQQSGWMSSVFPPIQARDEALVLADDTESRVNVCSLLNGESVVAPV